MATIGYGKLLPHTTYANILVVLETSTGIIGLAHADRADLRQVLAARPRACSSASARSSTIRDGVPCLMFRMANARATWIVEAEARVVLARSDTTLEGESIRRIHDLELSRTRNTVFALTWTVIHWITETSPLYRETPASLAASEVEIIVSVVGIDESLSQTVNARHSFIPEEIVWGARFVDVISRLPDGRRVSTCRTSTRSSATRRSRPPWLTGGGTAA